jgi:hypothetical protein
MAREFRIALACFALAATMAFAPANALARGGSHGGGHGGGHFGGGRHLHGGGPGFGPGFYPYDDGYAPGCVWVRRLVHTSHGPRWRSVPVCY